MAVSTAAAQAAEAVAKRAGAGDASISVSLAWLKMLTVISFAFSLPHPIRQSIRLVVSKSLTLMADFATATVDGIVAASGK